MSTIKQWFMDEKVYGKSAQNRIADAIEPTLQGAQAALESFYFSFNNQDIAVFEQVWAEHDLIQLNNPLGGIQRGYTPIRDLYQRIYEGPADVWVELHDIMVFFNGTSAVFAGKERGEFTLGGVTVPLSIRTTRFYSFFEGVGWQQVHHHGSIDDATLLQTYQNAVTGIASDDTIITAARVQVKPDYKQEFLNATQTLIQATRQEEGVLFFELYESQDDDNGFIFYEIFTSLDALKAHRDEAHTKTWFSQVSDILADAPVIQNLVAKP